MAQESRTEQSGYQFKKLNTCLQNCPVNHLCTSRPAGRELTEQYAHALKKITNAIKKTRNYTERDKR
jgi:hypothetical protein